MESKCNFVFKIKKIKMNPQKSNFITKHKQTQNMNGKEKNNQ